MLRSVETRSLRLRPLSATDREFYGRLYTDPGVMAQIGSALSREVAMAAFDRVLRQVAADPPRAWYWILHARIDEKPVGLMALVPDRNEPASAEVGVLLLPSAQGQGHATKAIAVLADHLFAETELTRLWTRHVPGHAAAIGLMRKLGFVPETVAVTTAEMPTVVRWQLLHMDLRPDMPQL